MKTIGGLCLSLLITTGLFAQNRSGFINPAPGIVRTLPSAVFPGGTSALPGVQRFAPNVVFPGGAPQQIGVPGIRMNRMNTGFNGGFHNGFNNGFNNGHRDGFNGHHNNAGAVTVYGYPVAVPVPIYPGGDGSYYDQPQAPMQQPSPTNVFVIYPPAPPQVAPAQPAMTMVPQQPEPETGAQPASADTGDVATHYLIAFKDHSIYSAVAYWVDGDTLHYFTTGNTHNQASLSLVDRELTRQLNQGSGLQVNLPAPK